MERYIKGKAVACRCVYLYPADAAARQISSTFERDSRFIQIKEPCQLSTYKLSTVQAIRYRSMQRQVPPGWISVLCLEQPVTLAPLEKTDTDRFVCGDTGRI